MRRLTLFFIFFVPVLLSPVFYLLATGEPAPEVVVVTATPDSTIAAMYAAVRAAANPAAMVIRANASGTLEVQIVKPYMLVTVTATPTPESATPTDTLIPTNTPRTTVPSATYTPSATATRRPTLTKTPTVTEADEPTPTQDTEPQPTEPSGTPPINSVCRVKVQAQSHALMSDHSATSTRLNWVPKATELTVERIYIVSSGVDEWVRVNYAARDGWMHVESNLRFTDDSVEACTDPTVTPTEYATGPTNTPVPTANVPTPTPLPPVVHGCEVWHPGTGTINVRNGPGKSYAVIDSFSPNESGIALRVHVISASEEWAYFSQLSTDGQNSYGYIALKIAGSALAALRGESCANVPRVQGVGVIPDGGPFASGKILPGVHISWPTNFDSAALAPYIGIAKCLPLTDNICRELKRLNPNIVTIWRDYRIENPTDAELRSDHTGYAARVYAIAQLDFDYIEPQNEMGFTDAQYPYLSDFIIDVAAYFGARGECILAPAFYPGWPDIGKRQWGSIVKYMQWAQEHPCGKWADGTPKYHGISWHSAAYYPGTVPEWPWVNWSFVAGNAILGDVQMREDYGFGIRDFVGPKIVSELGLTDGYQGAGSKKPTCYDNKLAVQETVRVYTVNHAIFDGFAFWNFGSPGNWTDETACLPDMFK